MLVQFPVQPPGGAGAAAWGAGEAPGRPSRWQYPALPPLGSGSWLWAVAWQPAAGGGWQGWCGVSASPEGPHGCVLSKRSGLMSTTCGTNFRGTRQPNHPPLGGRQDRCQPWGLSVSRLENQSGLLMVGGKLGSGEPGNTEPEASAELINTGLGNYSWGSATSFVFSVKHLLCAQHHPAIFMRFLI